MRSVKSFIAAGAATLLSQAAFAADMAIAPPPYAPPVVEDFGGWYLRGDIGFSNQRVDRLNNALDSTLTSSVQNNSFNTAGIFGLGVGYKVNNWFRADVTGEYRGNSQFLGTDRITYPAASAPTPITPPRTSGSFSPTPMSISAPGGASPRSSAPASAARGLRSTASPSRALPTMAAARCRASPSATTCRSGILPGRRMPVSPTRSRRTSPSNSPIAISIWATA